MGNLIEVPLTNIDEFISGEGLIVLTIGASWCGPCGRYKPHLEQVAEEYESRIKFGFCDVGSSSDAKIQGRIPSSIPDTSFFKNGKYQSHESGNLGVAPLKKFIEEYLFKA